VPAPEETSRERLIALLARRDAQIEAQDGQITALSTQVADLVEANEQLAAKLATLEHFVSRNSGNSSMPPSKDDGPGKTLPAAKKRRGGPARSKGKQPGAPGANLAWVARPDDQRDRFPQGRCECGHDLGEATDLGVVDRYQRHEIPQVTVKITQYDQHQVRCGCGRLHTASRGRPHRAGRVRTEPAGLRRVLNGGAVHPRRAVRRVVGVADRGHPERGVRARHVGPRGWAAGRGGPADPRLDHPGLRGLLR
jgi:hypothetical protein